MTVCFVAGATGYTGREVVRQLAAGGRRAVAHVRPDSARLLEWRERFAGWGAEVDSTPWDEERMTARLQELSPGAVFALLGTTAARGRRAKRETGVRDSYESVDYALTSLLIRAAVASGCGPKLVYLSSVGVSDRATGAYYRARAKVEAELRASGLPYVIARPSFIIGSDRDDARTGELVGATTVDAALSFARVLGAKKLAERYRSTSNVVLAAALVRAALDGDLVDVVLESESLR